MSRHFLPDITSSDREKRAHFRGLFILSEAKKEETRNQRKREGIELIEFKKDAKLQAANLFIKPKNPNAKEGAKNFHGIVEASIAFTIDEKEIREEFIKSRLNSTAVSAA